MLRQEQYAKLVADRCDTSPAPSPPPQVPRGFLPHLIKKSRVRLETPHLRQLGASAAPPTLLLACTDGQVLVPFRLLPGTRDSCSQRQLTTRLRWLVDYHPSGRTPVQPLAAGFVADFPALHDPLSIQPAALMDQSSRHWRHGLCHRMVRPEALHSEQLACHLLQSTFLKNSIVTLADRHLTDRAIASHTMTQTATTHRQRSSWLSI